MRGRWQRALALCLGLLALPALAQDDADASPLPGTVVLRNAMAELQPEGSLPVQRTLTLSHRWDKEFPGRGGTATYRISLPPRASGTSNLRKLSRSGLSSG